jgi:hypothetical protein
MESNGTESLGSRMRGKVGRFLAGAMADEKLTKAASGVGARADASWNASAVGTDKSRDCLPDSVVYQRQAKLVEGERRAWLPLARAFSLAKRIAIFIFVVLILKGLERGPGVCGDKVAGLPRCRSKPLKMSGLFSIDFWSPEISARCDVRKLV